MDRINKDHPWLESFAKYALANRPCIIGKESTSSWSCRTEWVDDDGNINLEVLKERYGNEEVPVVSRDCCEPKMMRFAEYIEYCSTASGEDAWYLKDWHFQISCGSHMYTPPPWLATDWVNSEKWTCHLTNPFKGDYRFLYFGVQGTWTGFHSDVLSSHSWSANICGRKLWYFVPPGLEKIFKYGQDFVRDIRERRDLWEEAEVFEIMQEAGELMFVPSNWYHQVHNLELTISLNHNSINLSNIQLVFEFLKRRLADVKNEIGHLAEIFSEEEMKQQEQMILASDARLNFTGLHQLLQLVFEDRCSDELAQCYVCLRHLLDPRDCFKDPHCLYKISSFCECIDQTCRQCLGLLRRLELSVVIVILDELERLL